MTLNNPFLLNKLNIHVLIVKLYINNVQQAVKNTEVFSNSIRYISYLSKFRIQMIQFVLNPGSKTANFCEDCVTVMVAEPGSKYMVSITHDTLINDQ